MSTTRIFSCFNRCYWIRTGLGSDGGPMLQIFCPQRTFQPLMTGNPHCSLRVVLSESPERSDILEGLVRHFSPFPGYPVGNRPFFCPSIHGDFSIRLDRTQLETLPTHGQYFKQSGRPAPFKQKPRKPQSQREPQSQQPQQSKQPQPPPA